MQAGSVVQFSSGGGGGIFIKADSQHSLSLTPHQPLYIRTQVQRMMPINFHCHFSIV